ncbi:MAG: RNA polymerase sigma factor RpoD/SigA [Cyclobacteriaceae bacterium]|nr:RNA polymerase sigma factor RpoD/SigA [Cyclobacteriaceae bacterium]MDH4298177.1 RNA polymerase sigma factor RpoD/SigA [Cyclobacteriaceae bacterium]MDH5248572.1 RNA polymerase sigma factor RpoD/SigA [Cyclobacteriaceae bacterium]
MRQLKITQKITNRESQSLDRYLTEIAKIDLITAEEEVKLAQRIREGDDKALERLVNANLRFVVSVAKQYQATGMTLSDLINEGNLGLIKAASRFDEKRGFKFISYAVWWIRQTILQALAEQSRIVRLPLNRVGALNKINLAFSELEQQHQREPTAEELAEVMETTPDEIRKTLSYRNRKVSMDAPLGHDSDAGTLLDVMPDATADMPDSQLMNTSMQNEIKRALSRLSEREAQVLSLHYGLSGGHAISLHEIGDRFDLSMERVRQIKEKATRKLRNAPRMEALKSYL